MSKKMIKQCGLTLIELMVSILLGAVLILGVTDVFLGMKQTYTANQGLSFVQQNARLALEILANDFRMAGFQGCDSQQNRLVNTVDFDGDNVADSEFNKVQGNSLEVYDGIQGSWKPALPTIGNWKGVNPTPLTDVIFLSKLEDMSVYIADAMPPTSKELKVTSVGNLVENDSVYLSDCRKSAVFAISKVQTAALHLQRGNTVNTGDPLTSNFTSFGRGASLMRVAGTRYYIADSTVTTSNRGDNPRALWRKVNQRNPEELVIGIEDLQILLGEDTDDDGVPNRYAKANSIDVDDVVSIRFRIVANSINPIEGNILSRVFTQTVNIRNRLVNQG